MKTKCPDCDYGNLEKSKYCQNCGYDLSKKSGASEKSKVETLHEQIEDIDDIIFKPKKKGVSLKNIIIGVLVLGVLGFVGILILAAIPTDENTTSEQSVSDPTNFPISYLTIADYEILYDDAGESYFTGILKNTYSKAARNVKVRLDFYYDEALKRHFDTRITIIESGAESNGAFSFEVPLTFYPQGNYWWVWEIEGADYGL